MSKIKYLYVFLGIIICLIAFIILNNKKDLKSNNPKVPQINNINKLQISINWDFEEYTKSESPYPFTKVYLIMKGNTEDRIYIGEYQGNSNVNYGPVSYIPNDAIMSCSFFRAGLGDEIYVKRDEDILKVFWKEVSEDYYEEGYSPEFEEIKVIKIPIDSEITI